MRKILRSPRALGIILLLTFGIVKIPLEARLSADLKKQRILSSPPELNMRESLGQMGFAATLGGLRSLVASITYLQAYVSFERTDWGKVDSLMTLTTRLQPGETTYWDEAAWHMAYNAASNYRNNTNIRAALRDKLYRDHVQRGIDILNEGLQYLPNNPVLLGRLGTIYRDRQSNSRLAAEYLLKSYENGAKSYNERMAAYEMVKLNDRESWEKAYAILKRYFDQGMRFSSILRDLPILEEKLNIPTEKRIPKNIKSD